MAYKMKGPTFFKDSIRKSKHSPKPMDPKSPLTQTTNSKSKGFKNIMKNADGSWKTVEQIRKEHEARKHKNPDGSWKTAKENVASTQAEIDASKKKADKLETLRSETEAGGKKYNKKGKKRTAAGRVGNWIKRGFVKRSKRRKENKADRLRKKIDTRDDAEKTTTTATTSTGTTSGKKSQTSAKQKLINKEAALQRRTNAIHSAADTVSS